MRRLNGLIRCRFAPVLWLLAVSFVPWCAADGTNGVYPPSDKTVETIVVIRHAEKPPGGLGNLTCRGLNRALALPNVLLPKYGVPDYIFAPNPAEQVNDHAGKFYYVRPLMTIEPTAIRCQLPINTAYGYTKIDQLAGELKKPAYQHALVFVAWEHIWLVKFARLMVESYGGNPAQVPNWTNDNYDTIFVFKITHQDGKDTLAFTVDHEGLNHLSDSCP
jgi:hypothetical protein